MKKFISVMLATLMLASTMSATIVAAEEVAEPVYVVAGSESLCGVSWNGKAEEASDNVMTFADGVYTKVFEDVPVADGYELKVVGNGSEWIGKDGTDFNVVFNVVEVCDVTVTMTTDKIITVTGDGVTFPEGLNVEDMFAVGAGDEAWMNDVSWDPSAEVNKMTKIADDVYEITFNGVAMFEEGYQGKFAANGAWTDSWGGVYTESGVAFDAVYNGSNIVVPVPYEVANVTLTLDLTAFDFATKTGAKATITVEDATETEDTTASEEVEDTTATDPVEDTTASEEVEDTTASEVTTDPVEDTTATDPVEDTTASEETTAPVEDTTATEEVEDTTASEETTVPVAEDVYVVAGSELLCGVNWKGNAEEAPENVMTESNGVYTKVFPSVPAANDLQFKVVKNNEEWIGDETGNNVTINVLDTCDVIVTYDPATGKVSVDGFCVELVKELVYTDVYAVGNAADEEDPWMNGESWNQAAEVNKMEEIADKVYQITFTGVEMFEEGYQAKFALDGEWAHSWGGVYTESGVAFEGVYNGDNIVVPVLYEVADVTLTLDLSNFDYASKTGAVVTVTVTDATVVDVIKGDVDGNGTLDVDDVTFLQMSLAGYEGYEVAAEVADVNGDGEVDVEDVTGIQFILADVVVG